MHKEKIRKKYDVVIYRKNGRYFKSKIVRSRYAAKQLRQEWEDKYVPMSYYVEIHDVSTNKYGVLQWTSKH
jgi:hypothetical protein